MASKIRILVVDDETRLRESLVELIARHGYEAHAASGGKAAVSMLETQNFDLLLLDLRMPDMTGIEVMQFINSRGLDVTVIVVSGDSSFDGAVTVLRQGAYDYVKKPYAAEELLRTVDNAVNKRRLEHENSAMHSRLAESEKLHRYIVNSSPDIIYMLDPDGCFTFLNERVESLLGYRVDDLVGKHYSVILHDEDVEQANYRFNERRTGERSSRNVELRLKCRDGIGAPRYFESNELPIEMSAMGVYARTESGGRGKFLGTYGIARDITERKRAEEIISYQANHDLLTGLPNRTLLKDRLSLAISHSRRNSQSLAVLFLDLDRFKLINDTLGHVAGDELLQSVSSRLKDCLREGDTLARVGGDEFMLLLPEVRTDEDAAKVAQKIIEVLKHPFTIDGHDVFVSVSIGVAIYPRDGKTLDSLIKNADIAMYHIKERGKDGMQFFSQHMNATLSRYLSLESGMRKALELNQFRVYYQPQVDIVSGQVVGLEALIRWQHPTRGLLPPMEFVPLAEENGLIIPIGDWLLSTACEQIARWRDAGLPHVRVAVNLSALQVEQPSFVERVISVLDQYGLPGSALELEITENVIMKDMDIVVQKLRQLSSRGIRIAIDDFGTGYSSLSYLRKLPIHTLKIDRSFVHDIRHESGDGSIVTAIVAMAKGLRLKLIAEGVEHQAQLDYLRALGCHEMQGFLFSRPLEASQARRLIAGGVNFDGFTTQGPGDAGSAPGASA